MSSTLGAIRAGGTIAGAMVLLLCTACSRPPSAKTPSSFGAGSAGDGTGIVIQLPFDYRMRESVREGGHQSWRSTPQMAAMSELGGLILVRPNDQTLDDPHSYRVIEEGKDEHGRPTVVIETKISDGSYIWEFRGPTVRLYMFENAGDVWITARIVIRPAPTK